MLTSSVWLQHPTTDDSGYTEVSFSLCWPAPSQQALQVSGPIVKTVQVIATRTVKYRRNAVLYGTR